ncbi:MAG: MauE/DoxX family redox-associated membrane protein [Parcubacteria group bacterium]
MHPEVVRDKPGKCPRCGMALVARNDAAFKVHKIADKGLEALTWKSYLPLFVILGVLLLTIIVISISDARVGVFALNKTISYFMIGFFLTFATFKLMDLKGFAEGYSTYDLLAQRWFGYGYVYPFIELFFGLAMILLPFSRGLLWAELVVMAFSGLGVAIKIARKEEFTCACLGTFLKVPLTKITLIEDFGMALLAGVLLIIS